MNLKAEQPYDSELDHIRDTLTGLVTHVSKTRAEMHKGFEEMKLGFQEQERRFAQINERFEQQDNKFAQVNERIDHVETEISQFKHEVRERFTGLENTLAVILTKLS